MQGFFSLKRLIKKIRRLCQQLSNLPEYYKKCAVALALVSSCTLFANTANSQNFIAPVANPFGLEAGYYMAFPTFVDIDADGDFDSFVGEYYGNTKFYENTGNVSTPEFSAGTLNPFGLASTFYLSIPTFIDIDADGDHDAFIGEYGGNLRFFENSGNSNNPDFAAPILNPFNLSASTAYSIPTFADIDADGDFDLFIGEYYGNIRFFENTGNSTSASYAASVQNPFGLSAVYAFSFPALVDFERIVILTCSSGSREGLLVISKTPEHRNYRLLPQPFLTLLG